MVKTLKVDKAELAKEKPTENKTPEDMASDLKIPEKELAELTSVQGVGPKTAEKLYAAGFKSLEDLALARPDEVAALMKCTYNIAFAWTQYAQDKYMMRVEIKKATQYDADQKAKIIYFKTGSSDVNSLLGRYYCPDCYVTRKVADIKCKNCGSVKPTAFLGGGVPTTSITGTSGRFASGKTQVGNDLIIDALQKHTCPKCYKILEVGKKCPKCNIEAKPVEVGYIETEQDTFHLDRLKEICGARYKKVNLDFDLIHVCSADQIPTAKAQQFMYKLLMRKIEAGANIHLIIIDSFNARFRAGYSRSEMLPVRAREFAEHFNLMEYMASHYNIAWYLTNQVIAAPRPDQGLANSVKYEDTYYPVGGDELLHTVNNWISLVQIKKELWKASAYDSSWIPRNSVNFILDAAGLTNGIGE